MPGKSCFCRKWTKPVLLLRPAWKSGCVCQLFTAASLCFQAYTLCFGVWSAVEGWASGLALLGSIFSATAETRPGKGRVGSHLCIELCCQLCVTLSPGVSFCVCRIRCQWSEKMEKGEVWSHAHSTIPCLVSGHIVPHSAGLLDVLWVEMLLSSSHSTHWPQSSVYKL